jgi:hypothetical protein
MNMSMVFPKICIHSTGERPEWLTQKYTLYILHSVNWKDYHQPAHSEVGVKEPWLPCCQLSARFFGLIGNNMGAYYISNLNVFYIVITKVLTVTLLFSNCFWIRRPKFRPTGTSTSWKRAQGEDAFWSYIMIWALLGPVSIRRPLCIPYSHHPGQGFAFADTVYVPPYSKYRNTEYQKIR